MARLIDAVDARFSTDFAILNFEQDGVELDLESGLYATSTSGHVAMTAGTKYAELDVRVECWDAQPPPADDVWEDHDIVPWRSLEGAKEGRFTGFADPEVRPVSLEGLDCARAEILAQGRNRYGYSDGPEEDGVLPRERWLLRLWPDVVQVDALAGPPRRLIGRDWLPQPRAGFPGAVQALRSAGWTALGLPFSTILEGLTRVDQAFTADDLLPPHQGWNWATEVTRQPSDRLDQVAEAAGLEILTHYDALNALIALGVFASVPGPGGPLLVPNPAPPVDPWDIVEPHTTAGYGSPQAMKFETFRTVSQDLVHLARWSAEGVLQASPERIATRLGITPYDVIGALAFLAGLGHRVDPLPTFGDDILATIALSAVPD